MNSREISRLLDIATRAPLTDEERQFIDGVTRRFRHRHAWVSIPINASNGGGWRVLCSALDCWLIGGPQYPSKDEAYRAWVKER